jgi:Predicted hydrolases or acyltransferases (alpha/beta hydrolase superfamily)
VLEADNLDKGDTVHVVGHAFGNRVARAFAHQYPDTVNKIVLVASGGAQNLREMPDVLKALTGSFKWWTPPPIRKSNVHFAFFADEHPVPPDWMRGWYIEAMKAQSRAVALTPEAEWRAAGGHAPILVLQGGDDRVAPAALTSESLRADYPDRVSIKVIPNAGHALLPEAPDDIANAIIAFLSTQKAEPR